MEGRLLTFAENWTDSISGCSGTGGGFYLQARVLLCASFQFLFSNLPVSLHRLANLHTAPADHLDQGVITPVPIAGILLQPF